MSMAEDKIIERKLQEISGSLLVTLPSTWTRQYNMKKGSKVDMAVLKDGTLQLAPALFNKEEVKRAVFDYDEFFPRRFFTYYLAGYDHISIKFAEKITSKEKNNIFRFISLFMNVEVIEEKDKSIMLQNFRIEELSIIPCLKRTVFLVGNMFDELLGENSTEHINDLDRTVSKFFYMLVMQVRKYLEEGKYTRPSEVSVIYAMDCRMAAEKIERVGDLIKEMSGKNMKEDDIRIFAAAIREMYRKSTSAFLNKDFEKAVTLWKDRKMMIEELGKLKARYYKKNDPKSIEFLNSLFQIFEYSKDIANLVRADY